MTKADIKFPISIGDNWANFLAQQYDGRHAAKRIAQDFGCEPRTAKAWLQGQPPQAAQLARAGTLFGLSAISSVLLPGSHDHNRMEIFDQLAVLKAGLDDVSQKLERLRNEESH